MVPNSRQAWMKRATHFVLMKRRKGRQAHRINMGTIPARRKCMPRNKKLRNTGTNFSRSIGRERGKAIVLIFFPPEIFPAEGPLYQRRQCRILLIDFLKLFRLELRDVILFESDFAFFIHNHNGGHPDNAILVGDDRAGIIDDRVTHLGLAHKF